MTEQLGDQETLKTQAEELRGHIVRLRTYSDAYELQVRALKDVLGDIPGFGEQPVQPALEAPTVTVDLSEVTAALAGIRAILDKPPPADNTGNITAALAGILKRIDDQITHLTALVNGVTTQVRTVRRPEGRRFNARTRRFLYAFIVCITLFSAYQLQIQNLLYNSLVTIAILTVLMLTVEPIAVIIMNLPLFDREFTSLKTSESKTTGETVTAVPAEATPGPKP